MNKTILVIAPHPDDETLGCAGLLHKAVKQGIEIHWLIVTGMSEQHGYSTQQVTERAAAIDAVAQDLGFRSVTQLGFQPAHLDMQPRQSLIDAIGAIVKKVTPSHLYLPYPGDAHSDHRIVFEAAAVCGKWFRYPSVEQVYCYETLSETGFGLDPADNGFRPNHYENISDQLDRKLKTLALYPGELGAFPFPRSIESISALASLRGSESGYAAAEAFMLLNSRHA